MNFKSLLHRSFVHEGVTVVGTERISGQLTVHVLWHVRMVLALGQGVLVLRRVTDKGLVVYLFSVVFLSEQASFHSLLQRHLPLNSTYGSVHIAHLRISKSVPGLFCFCLGIFSSPAHYQFMLFVHVIYIHVIFPFRRHRINKHVTKQSFTTVSLWRANSF